MEEKKNGGLGVHTRRVIAYVVLIFITVLCLFWFYVLHVFHLLFWYYWF